MFTLVGILAAQGRFSDSCNFLIWFAASAFGNVFRRFGQDPARLGAIFLL